MRRQDRTRRFKERFWDTRSRKCHFRHHIDAIAGTNLTGAGDRETLLRSRRNRRRALNAIGYSQHLNTRSEYEHRRSDKLAQVDDRTSPSQGTDNCTLCGQRVTAPENSIYLPSGKIVNQWRCYCGNAWETFVDRANPTNIELNESQRFRTNAGQYLILEGAAASEAMRFGRISAAWLALAETQDWLDGVTSPVALLLPQDRSLSSRGHLA